MKLKINAKNKKVLFRLPISASNLKVTENGNAVLSQWVNDGESGLLLVDFNKDGEHIIDINETNEVEDKTEYKSFVGAFPKYSEITFEDKVAGIAFAGKEDEEQVGKAYLIKNDKEPCVTEYKGNIAKVASVKAYYCDAEGKHAPFEPYAEYKWIFIDDLVFVCAKQKNCQNYSVSFLYPSLEGKEKYEGGYPLLSGNAENVGFGFDGYAVHEKGNYAVGVYGASCLVMPDGLVGGTVGKECGKHGEEITSAYLYVGDSQTARKYSEDGALPSDVDIEYIFDDSEKRYKFKDITLHVRKTASGAEWAIESSSFKSLGYTYIFKANTSKGIVTSSNGWDEINLKDDCIELFSKNGGSAKIVIKEKGNGFTAQLLLDVQNIENVYFPWISVGANGKTDLFVPSCAGQIEKDVLRRDVRYRESYAGPFANMGFLGPITETGKGFYICWEGEGERRDYAVCSSSVAKQVTLSSVLYPENMGETCHYSSNLVDVLCTENGWMGMCNEYRSYAQNTVWWNKLLPVKDKMEENKLWLWSHFRWEDENGKVFKGEESADEWYSVLEKIGAKIDVPLGVMAYDWYDNLPLVYRTDLWPEAANMKKTVDIKTGDGITITQAVHHETGTNYYPHYYPLRKGVKRVFEKAKENNMTLLTYIDSRLWDPRDYILGDFKENWKNTGEKLAVKDVDGIPMLEYYCHHLPTGEPADSAVVCPHTKRWQDFNAEIVEMIVNDAGVDGVYLDQIAAMPPALCMDKSHGHPVGGGTWWREGYEKMVAEMRKRCPDAILTTECEAEPYMHIHDAYLSWTHVLPNQVPAYTAVYSDAILQYGRTPVRFLDDVVDKNRVYEVRASFAQSYLFGEQLGFMFMRAMLACGDDLLPFMNKLLNERENLKEYFNNGRLICMPQMKTEEVFCDLWGRDMRPVYIPHVYTAIWEYNGKKKLLAVNPFDSVGTALWQPTAGDTMFNEKYTVNGKHLIDGLSIALEPQTVITLDIEE